MSIPLTTTTQLLDLLRTGEDDSAWRTLAARYSPVLEGVARQLGLRQPDAEDAAQQTLMELVREVRAGRFVHGRDSLRGWTTAVLRNRARDIQRLAARAAAPAAPHQLESIHDDRLEDLWRLAREQQVFHEAMERLRRESGFAEPTMRAFELSALRGVPALEAARACGMSRDEVYVARNRVLSRLRRIVVQVESEFEE